MKKLSSISFIIIIANAMYGQSGWQWQNPYYQGNDLNSIIMNGVQGWAVGDEGTVIHTETAWNDFEVVDIGTNENLNCVIMSVVPVARGWIVGNKGTIYYTEDGGENWTKQNSGTNKDLYSVSGMAGECIWVCGNDVILHAFHYGETWERINTVFHSNFYAVDQKDCDEIWISGDNGMVICTKDAGSTWQQHTTPTTYNLFSIDVVPNGDYRACGHQAVIVSSSDNGDTWIKENETTFLTLYDVDTKGIGGPAYAVGSEGTILETLNGGNTWTQKESPTINTLHDVCFRSAIYPLINQVFAVGRYGLILKKEEPAEAEFEIMNKLTHLWMQSVDFINSDTGWAVGGEVIDQSGNSEGVILHTTDGGKNWEAQLNIPYALSSVNFINENEGWAVGRKGIIKHTTNGGQNWGTQTSPLKGLLTAVSFVDKNNGWIVSRDNWGEIAHTTNGGDTWVEQTNPARNPLHSVFFINQNKGWAVGLDSTIILTTDGGQNWKRATKRVDKNYRFASVYFIDEMKGWTVGVSGSIMITNDGGLTWQQIKSGFTETFNSVYFTDQNNGWIVGESGCILRSINGGYTWFQLYSGVSINFLSSICFVDLNNGWVCGEGGTIKGTVNGGFWNEPGTLLRNRLKLPINDLAEIRDTLIFETSGMKTKNNGYQLVGLEVMIDSVIHTRASDLEISLSHNGITETLVNQVTDQGSNFLWTRFSDNAPKTITNGVAPFSGNHKPDNPLTSFNGLDPYGEWILTIYDNQSGHTGTLNAWGIKPLFEKMIPVGKPEALAAKPEIQLFQNIPNPFTGRTEIKWISDINGFTSLKVYNINGQEITTLINKFLQKGEYSVEFDGMQFSAGVYYYQLKVGEYELSKRCIVM